MLLSINFALMACQTDMLMRVRTAAHSLSWTHAHISIKFVDQPARNCGNDFADSLLLRM